MAPSKKLKKHAPILLCMSKNPSLSKALLASPLGQEIVHCVSECASNVLNGNTNLSQLQKRKLENIAPKKEEDYSERWFHWGVVRTPDWKRPATISEENFHVIYSRGMEHAKKLTLVEPKLLESLAQGRAPPNPATTNLSALDNEMTQVLNSDKAVRDKVQAYNQILQRYLVQQSKCIDSPIEVRVRPDSKVDTVDESTIEEPKLDTVEVDVFDSVPKTFTRKAQLLMRRCESNQK
ncbi:hypothetical protein CAPTEDRAFT_216233 [Capitella teleta]|uniref:Uncharacterized protein n=1 Tax=Capitella teleta TaxID=283909 RepID=R7TY97_CAPTE|nr:hypothetical protein CAPTEDRAFT_216233 [Capitella teleta]|eukprot:ELT98719.1 hypothetical protein CAPTEDRAFT_216233 [Capitella teleta]